MISRPVNRLFAFGCSFTKYLWGCWPEIIGLDLDIPFYNYGKSGAGNQYIANMITQADAIHKFTKDDLIIVSWTNVCREDKWVNGQWITPGNIFSQNTYEERYVKRWADPIGYSLRDFSTIKLIKNFLTNINCQYYFFSMCNIIEQIDQASTVTINQNMKNTHRRLVELYYNDLQMPSFYEKLWKNNIHAKFKKDKIDLSNNFSDGHPFPKEHLKFLQSVFTDHKFKTSTTDQVEQIQNNFTNFIKDYSKNIKGNWAIYELSPKKTQELLNLTTIKKSEFCSFI